LLPGFAACALAIAVTVHALRALPIDLDVYRAGARVLLHGTPLYRQSVTAGLDFTYPPLAAIVFVPLALLPPTGTQILVDAANLALLWFVCHRSLLAIGLRPGRGLLAATSLAAGLSFWLDPVRTTVYLGQVNLALLALVLWDLLRPNGRPGRGVGVGIAAGIKLTPLVFLPFLLVTRQFRAAIIATVTFVATVLVGFAIVPGDAADYWLGGRFAQSGRVFANLASPHNQSLSGLVRRAVTPATPLWLALVLCFLAATLVAAAIAWRRNEKLLAITLCGLAGCAVSPYSWNHHWVWLVPLGVFIGGRLVRGDRRWLLPAIAFPLALPWLANLADPPTGAPRIAHGPVAFLLDNDNIVIYVLALGATAWYLMGKVDVAAEMDS
jgi:alpha-1,2-mannosyltransferase